MLSLALAPMESLGWWAGWLGPDPEHEPQPAACPRRRRRRRPPASSSSSPASARSPATSCCRRETAFLDRLQAALPEARIVRDVFPYAPSGRPLITGQRVFTWLWRRVLDWRLNGTRLLPALLNLRNLFQVLVSADHRYGPLYSFGIARVARERLEAHGYRPESRTPVVLLGSSGGGQISVGAATYLGAELDAPLAIVTFGGVMASDRGVEEVTRLASLYGTADRVYALGRAVFPGRWPMASARSGTWPGREDRLSERAIGPMGHSGRGGYLDAAAPRRRRAVARAHRPRGRRRGAATCCRPPPAPRSRPSISADQHRVGQRRIGPGLERVDQLVPEPVRRGECEPAHPHAVAAPRRRRGARPSRCRPRCRSRW